VRWSIAELNRFEIDAKTVANIDRRLPLAGIAGGIFGLQLAPVLGTGPHPRRTSGHAACVPPVTALARLSREVWRAALARYCQCPRSPCDRLRVPRAWHALRVSLRASVFSAAGVCRLARRTSFCTSASLALRSSPLGLVDLVGGAAGSQCWRRRRFRSADFAQQLVVEHSGAHRHFDLHLDVLFAQQLAFVLEIAALQRAVAARPAVVAVDSLDDAVRRSRSWDR
jgi:hypothetical protein